MVLIGSGSSEYIESITAGGLHIAEHGRTKRNVFVRDSSRFFCVQRPAVETDTRSRAEIRHEQLRELQEQRPSLSDKDIDILLETWDVIQDNMDKVGTDMFVRWENIVKIREAFCERNGTAFSLSLFLCLSLSFFPSFLSLLIRVIFIVLELGSTRKREKPLLEHLRNS